MLTPEAKKKALAATVEETKVLCKKEIEEGISAERLSVNPDWLRLKADVMKSVADFEVEKIALFDSILANAGVTTEQKLKAQDDIRYRNQEMENFKFIIGLVEARVKRGEKAREELQKIEEAQS